MAYRADVLLDSVSPAGCRLTTFVLTYPRFVHAELLTHRVFSRNASSSRAIPVKKLVEQVVEDPVMPVWWGKNQPGMQAREELGPAEREEARRLWLSQRDDAIAAARRLMAIGGHKQIVNRLLEPWMWITVILSGTTYENFFGLRCHNDAQPELQRLAEMMRRAYETSSPQSVPAGGWHMPFIRDEDKHLSLDVRRQIAVARCARVSYLTHFGTRDIEKDVDLYERLLADRHMSPFEHVAVAYPDAVQDGNFVGWRQYRSLVESGEVAAPLRTSNATVSHIS